MNTIDTIQYSLNFSNTLVHGYLDDLSQDDWLVRPTEGGNHITWQIGHLISSTKGLAEPCFPGALPELPEGFKEKYSKEASTSDSVADFHSKDELMGLYEAQRDALLKAVAGLSEEDLEKPIPENLHMLGKSVGELCEFQALHWLMHAGQWAIVRRKLGHPPLF